MKKLLILLSAMTTCVASAVNVISCNENKYDHKSPDGDSYIYYYPNGKNDTNTHFSTGNAWEELGLDNVDLSNPNNVNKVSDDVEKSIAQSVMRNLNLAALGAIGDGSVTSSNTNTNIAQLSDIPSMFKDSSTLLTAIVNNKFQDQKNTQGKNWNKWLKDNYDGSENAYKSFLYQKGDGTSSASSMVSELLSNNSQTNYQYDQNVNLDTIKNYFNDPSTGIIAYYRANNSMPPTITDDQWQQISFAIGRSIGNQNDSDFKNNLNKLQKDITDSLDSDPNIKTYDELQQSNANLFNPLNNYDSNISPKVENGNFVFDYSNPTNSLTGFLSPSQEFIESNWFQIEKPLAVSQILVKYDNDGATKFDLTKNKLTGQKWDNLFSSNTISDLNSILNTSGTWDTLTYDVNSIQNADMSETYEPNLLTATATAGDDGFANDMFKTAVYSSLMKNQFDSSGSSVSITDSTGVDKLNTLAPSVGDTLDKSASYLLQEKNANYSNGEITDNDMFHILNIDGGTTNDNNVVAYFDTLGLHIVHIDGINNLTDPSTRDDNFLRSYTTLNQQAQIKKYNDYAHTTAIDANPMDNQFNNSTNSKYLDFLNAYSFNAQSTNPNLKTNYKFNVSDELKSFATFDPTKDTYDTSSIIMWFWQYEFIDWYINKDGWLDSLMKFPEAQAGSFNNIKWIFQNEIAKAMSGISNIFNKNIVEAFNNIINNTETNKKGPQGYYTINSYSSDSLWNNKYWYVWNIELKK